MSEDGVKAGADAVLLLHQVLVPAARAAATATAAAAAAAAAAAGCQDSSQFPDVLFFKFSHPLPPWRNP